MSGSSGFFPETDENQLEFFGDLWIGDFVLLLLGFVGFVVVEKGWWGGCGKNSVSALNHGGKRLINGEVNKRRKYLFVP